MIQLSSIEQKKICEICLFIMQSILWIPFIWQMSCKIKSYPKIPNDFASFESHEESNFFTIRVNGRVRVALIGDPRTSNLYNCPYGQCSWTCSPSSNHFNEQPNNRLFNSSVLQKRDAYVWM